MQREMVGEGMISAADVNLFRVTDDVEEAAAEIESFYRVFHSHRYVGDTLLLRLHRPLPAGALDALSARFADILTGPVEQTAGPLEAEDGEYPDLPRLVLPFDRIGFSRLRLLIDFVNQS
jgi:hypothetical protein